jgi:hypothetical protein
MCTCIHSYKNVVPTRPLRQPGHGVYFFILYGLFFAGAIFIEGDASAAPEAAFRHAIDLVNADRNVLVRSRLTAHIEKVPPGDSFKASQKGRCYVLPGLPDGVVFHTKNANFIYFGRPWDEKVWCVS